MNRVDVFLQNLVGRLFVVCRDTPDGREFLAVLAAFQAILLRFHPRGILTEDPGKTSEKHEESPKPEDGVPRRGGHRLEQHSEKPEEAKELKEVRKERARLKQNLNDFQRHVLLGQSHAFLPETTKAESHPCHNGAHERCQGREVTEPVEPFCQLIGIIPQYPRCWSL